MGVTAGDRSHYKHCDLFGLLITTIERRLIRTLETTNLR